MYLRALVVFLCLALLRGQTSGGYYLDYAEGLRALSRKEYSSAADFLSRAIQKNPRSARSPRYTPFYYLGICHQELGRLERAVEAYDREESQGVIHSFPEDYSILTENLLYIKDQEAFQVIVIDRKKKEEERRRREEAEKPKPKPKPPVEKKDSGEKRDDPAPKPDPKPPEPPQDRDRPVLRAALLSYLGGEYEAALDSARLYLRGQARQAELARFVAGASLYSQFLLSGESDEALRSQAVELFRQCGAYRPPEDLISPRVYQFFRQQVEGSGDR